MTTADQSVLKIYSDRAYEHTTMVRHQGTALAFAMDDKRRLVYTVLDLSAYDAERGELDAAYWSENPVELPFPNEIVKVGYALVGATAMPVVKKGGRTEARPQDELEPEETDRFLSTTARLTAKAPFQVLSDGTHVVVLRQAIGGTDPDAVHALIEKGLSSGNAARADFLTTTGGVKVPVVADTLLCDRFLLVGGRLKPVTEVRFKRSRHRTQPASAKDSLGASDMDGKPFHEPTQELAFIRNLTGGRFAAVLTPTSVQGQQRWQFFAHNGLTQRIDSFNVEQGDDGLFNTRGTRFWTSPDAKYRDSVFEREPGTCPFTGLTLVPVAPETRLAETALQLNGTNAYVDLGAAEKLKVQGGSYALEAWVRRDAAGGPVVARWAGAGQTGFQLRITNDGKLTLDHGAGTVATASQTIATNVYTHVAVSFDGADKKATLYVNGAYSISATLANATDGTASLRIGSAQSGGFFAGVIDEVRIWNRVRTQAELADERAYRLIGNEPGLTGYYRLDEGSGTAVYDQTDSAANGTVTGAAAWITSEAPVSDHPGVRRDSFTVKDRTVVSGLAASLYYQQEEETSGYRSVAKPAKKQARVLLACATRPTADAAADAHIATVDFGVGGDGRLAAVPDVLTLVERGSAVEQTSDVITQKQQQVDRLKAEKQSLTEQITTLNTEKSQKQTELTNLQSAAQSDAYQWKAWLYSISNSRYITTVSRSDNSYLTYSDAKPDRWQLQKVTGATGLYGNPVVALRQLDANNLVLETSAAYEHRLKSRAMGLTPPTEAQWYIKGNPTTGFKLQNVKYNYWFTLAGLDNESAAANLKLEKSEIVPGQPVLDVQSRINVIDGKLGTLNRDLTAKDAEIQQANNELAQASSGLLGNDDLVLPLGHIGIDAGGLSSAGALLKFARTGSTPFLMDSAMGRLVLYFRGANGQFFAAYLDTTAVRGVQQLTKGGVTLLFTARDPGVDLSGARIEISDCVVNGAAQANLCNLRITLGTDNETFAQLPRKARDLAAALNGSSEEPLQVGTVASVAGGQVNLTQPSTLAVTAPAYVQIDETTYLVTTTAPLGSTNLRVTPSPPAGTESGTKVGLVRYDPESAAASSPGASLANGSRWVTVSADKADIPVPNGTAAVQTAGNGHGSRWRGDSPGRAFRFNGTAHRLTLPATQLGQLTNTAGDLTAEAWVNPRRATAGRTRILHANRGDTKAALALDGVFLTGGMTLDGTDDAALINNVSLSGTDFTVECWLKRTAGRTVPDTIVSCGAGLNIGFTATGEFRALYGAVAAQTTVRYTDSDWHHWAVTFNRATRRLAIVRDGAEITWYSVANPPTGLTSVIVGRNDSGTTQFFSGQLAEFRIWSTARTPAEIDADKDRRVQPNEPGLTGSWSYDPALTQLSRFADIGGQGKHGGVWGTPAAASSVLTAYRVLAAVGDRYRQSKDTYPGGEWAHLAAVYEQSWALGFDGSSWAETPDADQLDIPGDLTIEVFAKLDAVNTRQGLLSKGRLGDGGGGSVPYQLSVLADGKLEFAFEEVRDQPGVTVKRFTSAKALTAGFRRISVVRQAGRTTTEVKGRRKIAYTDQNGAPQEKEVDAVERVDVQEWQDIRFVVDGVDFGTGRYEGPGPRGNDGFLELGRARDGAAVYGLKGAVGEVRIWGRARDIKDLGTAFQPRDEGLLARWTFEENTGNTTADPVGGFDLKLRRAQWTVDPDPRASSFVLYRNGEAIPCDTGAANVLTAWGGDQLTLGAVNTAGTTFGDFFNGTLEEVRLWRTARAPEQILDNLFTRLKGDKQDLLGYWPFDAASTTATAEAVRDHSLRGNDLDPGNDTTRPEIVLSTAPVSTDTAAVRSALAGVRTAFHQLVSAPPAATEYADLQYTPSGEASGVLKRAYSHLLNGSWHLTTGYKVGDLISEWVSQVQFDPQLIGYIEGAPPVPSENLTGGTDPAGCSEVTFKEADEVTSTLSTSHERSTDVAFNFAVGEEVDEGILLITAPLGIGTAEPAVEVTFQGMVGGSFEFSNAWTNETTVSQGTSTDRDTTATLTGHREARTSALNPVVGPRYVPLNYGYALVQSETADVYALRLAHSGALVAYRMLPNPDIPKDWNIISFPINPQYTKQGTLDGAVGFNAQGGKVLDPAYPTATQRGEYSYFKPREAYALKRRILRERQQLENYYATVSTDTGTTDPTQERAAKVLESVVGSSPTAPDRKQPTESAGSFANRNIVNTYVWTADGGFFAESTGTVDVVTETAGGSYSVTGAVTASLEGGFEVMGVGIGFQMDGSVGGGTTVTRSRAKEATRSHNLDVTCNPTRDLQKYKDDGTAEYDTKGNPVLVPGKVDAYRFMSFYLGQDIANFDDFYNKVVDPTWIANNPGAAAGALRQARQSDRKPPCWRVMHRVTYISRILPPLTAGQTSQLDQELRRVDIQSNYELIRRLDPYVSTATGSRSRLAAATRAALADHLPQLLPHEADISRFLADYYGIPDDRNE
ncbi:LamG-like jellyroll fold domain-containing protein [Streptomyces uncialis]|uniref:LamG-like jellyroll fold domain-containing protein n=1 Tax=Streptomyces uncialis TaxID=1048205 RepID=UPI00386C155C|nr:hypothetical protein OG268_04000 [Streptomyces uncialis]